MKLLVIAPHPDDESIGCGGALCLHADRGDQITVAFLTSGEWGLQHLPREDAWRIREAEAHTACKIIGISSVHFFHSPDQYLANETLSCARRLAPLLRELTPELIYLPQPLDSHPDHKATLPILRAAFQLSGLSVPKLLGFEIWSPMPGFTQVQEISGVMARKLRAVRAHHSQVIQIPYDRAIQGLNRYRGILAGQCRYAEVFQELYL